MKKILPLILLLLSIKSFASHLAGAELFYKSLGGNQYLVTLNIFRDCSGISQTSATLTFSSSCGQNFTMPGVQAGPAVNVSQLCPSQMGNTTCNGGTYPGMEKYTYTVVATLPPCASWVISWTDGSRNTSTNCTNSSSANFFVPAFLNNVLAPTNNSPYFNSTPQPYFCIGQQACLNLATVETDGHTLSYALVNAWSAAGTALTYSAPYTAAQPILGITINPATGELNFTPGVIGKFIVVVECTERDAANNIIGTVRRDFQVVVENCSNLSVSCNQGNITNVSSGTVPPGLGNTLQICENVPFCFDVNFTDPNVTDSIKVTSPTIATSLPGSTMVMTYTPGIKNSVKVTICWTPPPGSSGLNTNFALVVKDNACPIPSQQTINYFIDVLPATSAGPDRIICGPQSAQITATGSSTVFAWSDLAGNPIAVGPEFSCNPCSNPIIKPAVTSTYVVTNVGGGANCKNQDTLIINVVPDFTLTAGVSIASSCLNSAVQFTSSVSPAGAGYIYAWSPAAPLTTTNTANTSATYTAPGSFSYTLMAISPDGCTKQSNTVNFTAAPVTMPIFTVTPTNTTVCGGSSFPLDVNFGASIPTSCGLATSGCVAPSLVPVGNGAVVNSTTGYPAIYGNWFKNTRHQLLFKASELLAAGVVPGKISSIAFYVTTINGATSYPGFTIKLKCTSAANQTANFDNAGLVQVYTGNITVTTGWNTYNFTQAYEWDGTSNLIVDVCNALTANYTNNCASPYTTTPFTSVTYYSNDVTVACGYASAASTSSNRPNVRFGNCSSSPDPLSFSYSWSPSTGLSSTTVKSPTATIASSQNYTVVVTPTAAVTCSNVGTTNLTITTPVIPTVTAVAARCSNAPVFTLTANPTGGSWTVIPGVTAAGVATPSLMTVGNNTVTYTYGSVGCQQTATTVVTIERFVPSTITGTVAIQCVSNPTINLATALTTSTLGTGVWSGPGVSGTTFNPATANIGVNTLTYSTNSAPTGLCPSSSTISITVSDAIVPTIAPEAPRCSNAPNFTLQPTPAGGTWSVTPFLTVSGAFTPSVASAVGNNTVVYTYVNGACTRTASTVVTIEKFVPATITGTIAPKCTSDPVVNLSTAVATATPGIWSGPGVTGTTFDPATATVGINTLTYSTNSQPTGLCPQTATLDIQVNSIVQPTITPAGPFCTSFPSQTMLVNATSTGGTWSAISPGTSITASGILSPASTTPGNSIIGYTLTSGACKATTSATVQIVQFTPATIIGALGPYCIYESTVNLQPIALNLGGVWSGNGVTGSTFDPATAGAGTHTITYSTDPSPAGLCPDNATTNIVVNPIPIINALPTSDDTGCNPWPVTFNSSLVNTGTAVWNFGDGNTGTGLPATHTYTVPGVYTAVLSYTDNAGCVNSASSSTVEIYDVPEPSFNATPENVSVIDAEIHFENNTTGGNNNAYEWNFGGLASSTETNPIYLFTNAGTYEIKLVATSTEGCKDSIIKIVIVTPDVVLYVPNSFTPNGDGLNDVFQVFLPPTGVDYTSFNLTIYDRWGEMIYRTGDVNDFWNGAKNNSGPILKQETYIWKITFRDDARKYYEKVGHVTLLGK